MIVTADNATDAKKICAAKFTGDASTAAWDAATVTELAEDTLGTAEAMNGWRYMLALLDASPVLRVTGTLDGVLAVTAATLLAADGGTGYTASDVLTVVGGTGTAATITVDTVSGAGAVLTASVTTPGLYSVLPTNPVTVTGGTGTGAGFVLVSEATGVSAAAIVDGGTLYEADDVLTVVGGTGTAATITVDTVDGAGIITAATVTTAGEYTVEPSDPVSVTGGAGTLATFNLTFADLVTSLAIDTFTGLGYEADDILTVTGGTSTQPAKIMVDTVDGSGVVLTHHVHDAGHYSVAPSNPVSVTGGAGDDDVKFTLTLVEDSIHAFGSDIAKALNATAPIAAARYAPGARELIVATGSGDDDLGDKTITFEIYPPLVSQADGSPANAKVNIPGLVSSLTDGGASTDDLVVTFEATTFVLPGVVSTIKTLE